MNAVEIAAPGGPLVRSIRAFMHELFCEGRCGERLIKCRAAHPGDPHDEADNHSVFFRDPSDGVPMAAGRLVLGPDLPTADIYRQFGWPLPANLATWSEPSRLGRDKQLEDAAASSAAFLAVVGAIICYSLQRGRLHWLLTFRQKLFLALRQFPYEIVDPPFLYLPPREDGSGKGGPEKIEPIFACTLYVPDILASMALRPEGDNILPLMFPGGLPSCERYQTRPPEELKGLAATNLRLVHNRVRAWRSGALTLPVYEP
jgi:hypothetical protein